jgi:CDP-6-deoxy-D-xylo-4-hexulose-3-dehydrase
MNWPLNVNNFTENDKEKISKFILDPDSRWTQDTKVSDFEKLMADYVSVDYSVFVSSGSTANTLIAMYLKDSKKNTTKNTVVFPSTTWITSISPFLREGFIPKFIDVNLEDLSIDLDSLEEYLKINNQKVACVFITSLLGFVPDIDRLKNIENNYNVKIMLDNCENTFGTFNNKNVSHYFTSTTSTYFGHQLQSIEGGFVFTNSEEEYEYFLMGRNHGMVRSLKNNKEKYQNNDVDDRFDFYMLGNNFRNTNLNAFIGILDFNRVEEYTKNRIELYDFYKNNLDMSKHILPKEFPQRKHVAFSLPIISKNAEDKEKKLKICDDLKIETRPLISGNLLRQNCLKKYDNFENFKNSEFLHTNAFYVGLHNKLTKNDIEALTNHLNCI